MCAAAARVLPAWDMVFVAPGDTRLLGADSYYHLRHARFAAQNFPHLLRWDPGTFYPNGQISDAAGLFDLAIAGTALVAGGGHADDATVAVAAAILPAALGVASFLVLYLLAAGTLGPGPALVACGLYLLTPGPSLSRTELGFADHHAAEIVLSLWVTAALARHLATVQDSGGRMWWRPAFWAPLPLALFVFTWKGAPAHLLITGVAIFVFAAFQIGRGRDLLATAVVLWRYGLGLLVMVGAVAFLWPELVLVPNMMTAIFIGAVTLALGPGAYLMLADRYLRRGVPPVKVVAIGLVGVAAAAAVGAWLYPDTAWLLGQLLTRKTLDVMEHQAVTPGGVWALYGAVGVMALCAVPLATARCARGKLPVPVVLPMATGMLVTAWWAWSRDYDYYPAPYLAYMAAVLLAEVDTGLKAFSARRRHSFFARWAGWSGAGLLVLLPVMPFGSAPPAPWPDHRHGQEISPGTGVTEGWIEAMTWLRTATPAPSITPHGRVAPWPPGGLHYPPDSYGVLSAWDFGNLISALGDRSAVRSGWPSARTARWFLLADESVALAALCPDCQDGEQVRYVVLDGRTLGPHFIAKVKAAHLKPERYSHVDGLWVLDGAPVPHWTFGPEYTRTLGATLYQRDGDGLGHFRLVYDSPHQSYRFYSAEAGGLYRRWRPVDTPDQKARFAREARRTGPWRTPAGAAYDGVIEPSVKIFEVVAGARVRGRTAPYARVHVELELRSATTGRNLTYRKVGVAGDDGGFEVIVPYATVGASPASVLTARGSYRLWVETGDGGGGPRLARTVGVPESAVRDGTGIELGNLD